VGLDEVWDAVLEHRAWLESRHSLETRRAQQQEDWMWAMVDARLTDAVRESAQVRELVADLVAINKADLDAAAAMRAEAQITSALRVFGFHGRADKTAPRWQTRVMRMSALSRDGIAAFWDHVEAFHRIGRANGDFDARRRRQATAWLWDIVHAGLQSAFRAHPAVRDVLEATLADVAAAKVAPPAAAHALLDRFGAMRGPRTEKT
jgi:putative protein kinase ArgK-like GTPase of G3E family